MRRKVICQKIWIGVGYSKDVLPMVNGQTKLTSADSASVLMMFVMRGARAMTFSQIGMPWNVRKQRKKRFYRYQINTVKTLYCEVQTFSPEQHSESATE